LEAPSVYLDRAAKARCAASEAVTPDLRAGFLRLEASWLRMAATAALVFGYAGQDTAGQVQELGLSGAERPEYVRPAT
jgi:hypothetical protein